MLLVVLLVGLVVGSFIRNARVQSDAVAAIREAGGAVRYEWESKGAMRIGTGPRWAPTWLVDRTGVDIYGSVRSAWPNPRLSERVMFHIGNLARLEVLDLGYSSVRDFELANLSHLNRLRHLSLSDTKVTDEGLAHLERLSALESLVLIRTRVTDRGLKSLGGMRNLRSLHLDNSYQ